MFVNAVLKNKQTYKHAKYSFDTNMDKCAFENYVATPSSINSILGKIILENVC